MNLETLLGNLNDDSLYRFHLAKPNKQGHRPIDALLNSDEEWLNWQIYKGKNKNRFVVNNIISFAQFNSNKFLFGGIFEITNRNLDHYEIKRRDVLIDQIGRLVIKFNGDNSRGTIFKPSYIYKTSEISHILEDRYIGEKFTSYEDICHSFSEISQIVKKNLNDWKSALKSVYGIYLITDKANGKHYIGSAYGDDGIWGRWNSYIYEFHGNNTELIKLFSEKSGDYFKENFQFSILEIISPNKSREYVIQKEALWKRKILSRRFGYNSN